MLTMILPGHNTTLGELNQLIFILLIPSNIKQEKTFSNFNFTGTGFNSVTRFVISLPIRNASSFVEPASNINILYSESEVAIKANRRQL